MSGGLARLLGLVAVGVAAGCVVSLVFALAIDRDLEHGLSTLALERGVAITGLHALAGAAGGLVAASLGVLAGSLARRASARAQRALRLAVLGAGLLPVAACAAWTLRRGLPDDRIPESVSRLRAPMGPNVLLVVMDTVRADRLSSYGYARPTTPELDAFSREAIRFPSFYANAGWTLPSHASLFTGLYPMAHGASQEHLRLERRFATLAERLRDVGYRTFAASANPIVGPDTGLAQGFARFAGAWREPPAGTDAAEHPVSGAFARFLAEADPERPYFAFLNYMEAHSPYTPPLELQRRFTREPVRPLVAERIGTRRWYHYYLDGPYPEPELALLSDLYDGEVAQLSAELGRLLETLRRDARWEHTLVAITADHGEHFGEHGMIEHMFSLYEPIVRVPLLLRLPGGARAGEVDSRLGQLSDLGAALLRVCGVDPASLAPQAVDLLDPTPRRTEVVAEYYFPNQVLGLLGPEELHRAAPRIAPYLRRLRALQRDGLKLIWGSDGRNELYDLRVDPGETRDGFAGGTSDPAPLLEDLSATVARFAAPPALAPPRPPSGVSGLAVHVDPDTAARLRELGYAR